MIYIIQFIADISLSFENGASESNEIMLERYNIFERLLTTEH